MIAAYSVKEQTYAACQDDRPQDSALAPVLRHLLGFTSCNDMG